MSNSVNNQVVSVSVNSIVLNRTILSIYSTPKNYEDIKKNILKIGIIQPILVDRSTMEVVSGNLRLQIARDLGYEVVPVLFFDLSQQEMDIISISSNQQREKSYMDIKRELDFIDKYFNVSQGSRSDLFPQLKEESARKKSVMSNIPTYAVNQMRKASKLSKQIYGDGGDSKLESFLKRIDQGKGSLNSLVKNLDTQAQVNKNSEVVPDSYELKLENFLVFNQSCEKMTQLESNSVTSIITSPPYFQMRKYGNGEFELGLEADRKNYIQNLISIFNECHRVLKDDGSLVVNINEKVENGAYRGVCYEFILEMLNNGWRLNDEIIWLKNNPVYTEGKRTVRSHEYIYHFVKSDATDFYYDTELARKFNDPDGLCVYGSGKLKPKFFSGMDFRDGIIQTDVANTGELRKLCSEVGFSLTHSATFPIAVPALFVLLTSKIGDIVLDPFCGTGTTGQAAFLAGRKFVGYELNPQFVMATEVRMNNMSYNYLLPKFETTTIKLIA
jgi:DNA modification methylase